MKKSFVWMCVSLMTTYAAQVYTPVQQIDVGGVAKDIVVHDGKLYIGTDMGALKVYDYAAKEFIKTISVPQVKDFTGEMMPARVSGIDHRNGRYLLLSDSGIMGYTNLRIHENNVTHDLFTHTDKKTIVKVRFVDDDHILMGTLGNEAVLFDLKSGQEIYRKQLSHSKFSDFSLSADKKMAVFGCESGIMYVIETATGKIVHELTGVHRDNTYKVDIASGIVAGAGQDRRGSLFNLAAGRGEYVEGDFLIYAVGLSPDARRVAFALDEQNNISVFDVSSRTKIALLKGQKSTLNTIVFTDANTLFSASDDNLVMMWKIP